MSVTAYQLDNVGLLIHEITIPAAADKGHLQVIVTPPEIPAGSVAQWTTALSPVTDGVEYGTEGTGTWSVLENHRKDTLWSAYQTPYTIGAEVGSQTYNGLGPVPAWLYETEPPIPLATARTNKIAALTTACAAAITAGFQSSALGSAYTYPSTLTDQSNQQSAASNPSGGSLWCESAGGTWALVAHTQAQAQAVLESFVAQLNSCQEKLATLTTQVNAATTAAAAQAIAW